MLKAPSRTKSKSVVLPCQLQGVLAHQMHIKCTSNQDVLTIRTLDWETVSEDPTCEHFNCIFMTFHDEDTVTLLDTEAMHPFAPASKPHDKNFPF